MLIHEVDELLERISAVDRRPFPPGAAATWIRVLHEDASVDVWAAFDEMERSAEVPKWLPGVLHQRARTIRETRERAARRGLPAAPLRGDEPSQEYKDFRRRLNALAARMGDLDRPARKADVHDPFVSAERAREMEIARARALATLGRQA